MWNAVQKRWADPQLYAVYVRDHPRRVIEELERLLSALNFYWERTGRKKPRAVLRENLPARTEA